MAGGQSLSAPDLLALGDGDAVDVGPLEGGGDDTWLTGDVLGVAVAGSLAWGAVWQLRVGWVDDLNWGDVLVVVPGPLGGDDHVVVIDQAGVVLWVSKLRANALSLSLGSEGNGTSTGSEVVGGLLAVGGAHDLVAVDDGTTTEVRSS